MYHVTIVPTDDFLVIPEVSSERRAYVPIGYLKPPVIPIISYWLFKMRRYLSSPC